MSLQRPGASDQVGLAAARRPLLVGEPADEEVVDDLSAEAEVPRELARDLMRDARLVIDALVADDVPVVDEGLVLAPRGHPVVDRLKERLADLSWQPPPDLLDSDDVDLASALGLPVEVVRNHRLASFSDILLGLIEKRGLSVDGPEAEVACRFLAIWLDTFKVRRYFVSHIGREAAFESWLMENLKQVTPYDLVLLVRQWQSQDRKHRPDLICRVRTASERLKAGTVLVLELKAGVADEQAVAQVERYLPVVRAEFPTEQHSVAGMLVADGLVLGLHEELTCRGIGYASASELGYRDYVATRDRATTPVTIEAEPTALAHEEVLVQTNAALRGAGPRGAGPWKVDGQPHATRRSANRALGALLGTYTSEQWAKAQRDHGLR